MKINIPRLGLIDLLGIILVIAVLAGGVTFAGDPGIGWHMKAGQWIAKNQAIPFQDPFLFTSIGKRWIHNQWLADLIFWSIYKVGGWPLLHAFAISLMVCIYSLVIFPLIRKLNQNIFVVVLLGLLGSFCVAVQWFLRPLLFSFLFFSIVLKVLYLKYESRKFNWLLSELALFALCFVLWANLHPGVILGLVLMIFYSMACFIDSRIIAGVRGLILFCLCLVSSFVNPYGIGLYKNIFELAGNKNFMNLNVEWLTPEIYISLFWPYFALLMIFLTGLLLVNRNRMSNKFTCLDYVLVVPFIFMSLMSRRYIPFAGMVLILPLIKLFSGVVMIGILSSISVKQNFVSEKFYTVVCLVGLLISTYCLGHLPGRTAESSSPDAMFPKKAIEVIKNEGIGKKIFTTPDWGGYITWELWPANSTFIDDRNELNGVDLYKEFFVVDQANEGWREIINKYGFQWVLLREDSVLGKRLQSNNQWIKVFQDKQAILFRKQNS